MTDRLVAKRDGRGGPSSFGDVLRRWRLARGLSQLTLATEAEISTRHLSFMETGRVRRALGFMLTQQEPYPALVIDRHWNVLLQNEGANRLLGLFLDREVTAEIPGPPNAARLTFHPRGSSMPLLALALRKDDIAVGFFTTLATVGAPQDITLQELRVECFFPADEATDAFVRRLAAER